MYTIAHQFWSCNFSPTSDKQDAIEMTATKETTALSPKDQTHSPRINSNGKNFENQTQKKRHFYVR